MICYQCAEAKKDLLEITTAEYEFIGLCRECLFDFEVKTAPASKIIKGTAALIILLKWTDEFFNPRERKGIFSHPCPLCGQSFSNLIIYPFKECSHCFSYFFVFLQFLAEVSRNRGFAVRPEPRPPDFSIKHLFRRLFPVETRTWNPPLEVLVLKERYEAFIRDKRYGEAKELFRQMSNLERQSKEAYYLNQGPVIHSASLGVKK